MTLTVLITPREIAQQLDVHVNVVRDMIDHTPDIRPSAFADSTPIYGLEVVGQLRQMLKEKRWQIGDTTDCCDVQHWVRQLPIWVVLESTRAKNYCGPQVKWSLYGAGVKSFGDLVDYKGDLRELDGVGPATVKFLEELREREFTDTDIFYNPESDHE